MKVEALIRPLSIRRIRDGSAYLLPAGIELAQTNLFLKVGQVDELFIKTPSRRGLEDYRKFVKLARPNPADLRPLDAAERFENLKDTLANFSDLKPIAAINPELAHYLAVHKLQYERLRGQSKVGIPQARFGVFGRSRFGIFRTFEPALFQESIPGTTLWQMFDFAALRVAAEWRPYLPAISYQLTELLRSPLASHIDWNIQNFVFNSAGARLFYVDSKPTAFVAKESNELNLKGLRDHFLS